MNAKPIIRVLNVVLAALALTALVASAQEQPITATEQLTPAAPPGIDLDVTYIERTPRYSRFEAKQWPDPGELVTFTAHIMNKGTQASGSFNFQWLIDGQVVSNGTIADLGAGQEKTRQKMWNWVDGRHTVAFRVDPGGFVAETAEVNNVVEDVTDALTISWFVEFGAYARYGINANMRGTYSFEDWAQGVVAAFNQMAERSKYPDAPNGTYARVRFDKLVLLPDGTLPVGWYNPPSWISGDLFYETDVQFQLSSGENWEIWGLDPYLTDIGRVHETLHGLGHVDMYGIYVAAQEVLVTDTQGNPVVLTSKLPGDLSSANFEYPGARYVHVPPRWFDIMVESRSVYPTLSEHNVYALNRHWAPGVRTPRVDYGDYLNDLPAETVLQVLDSNSKPLVGAKVEVFHTPYLETYAYAKLFDNVPDIVGLTDSRGEFSLGAEPFGGNQRCEAPRPTGCISAAVALIRMTRTDGQVGYAWLEIMDLNLAYWRGETARTVYKMYFPLGTRRFTTSESKLVFFAEQGGKDPRPQTISVNLVGDPCQPYVCFYGVSSPDAPWLSTIPSPDNDTYNRENPPGPLTFIIDTDGLAPGHYTTSVTLSTAEDSNIAPKTVPVNLYVRPAGSKLLYISSAQSGTAGGVAFAPSDILVHDPANDGWAMFFDASDLGITKNVDDFAVGMAGNNVSFLVLALQAKQNVPGLGLLRPQDFVAFYPSSLGNNTAGVWGAINYGATHNRSASSENIDALTNLNYGVLMSTTGAAAVPYRYNPAVNITPRDEDLFLYDDTVGKYDTAFVGANAGLAAEDVVAAEFMNGVYYLTILGSGVIDGHNYNQKDIFMVDGNYNHLGRFWNGPAHGFNYAIDAIAITD